MGSVETPMALKADEKVEPELPYYAAEPEGAGWIMFSAIVLGFAGTLAVLAGIVGLSRSAFFVNDARFVFSDLHTWSWIVVIVGSLTILAAFSVVAGSQWGRWFGIVVAGLNAIAQLAWIQAYPFWALCIFTMDILVIYGLAVYGGFASRRE